MFTDVDNKRQNNTFFFFFFFFLCVCVWSMVRLGFIYNL